MVAEPKALVLTAAVALGAMGCSGSISQLRPLEVVPYVDLDRYTGTWYEIARYPNRFQRDCHNSRAEYQLRRDGDIRVVNTCNKGSRDGPVDSVTGKAWVVDRKTNAKLKVRFFWPFSGDYWVIELDENYEYSVVGEPDRQYLWILGRRPTMSEATYQDVLSRLERHGYDPAKLVRS